MPPPPDAPRPPAPYDDTVTRGVQGQYSLTGGRWFIDTRAYSHRYVHAFDRVSVYRTDAVFADAIRVTQPDGAGPPLEGMNDRFAALEIELYLRDEPERYTRERSANLLARDRLRRARADATDPATDVAALTDGLLSESSIWRSVTGGGPHWVLLELDGPARWNQLVVYWPSIEIPGPWHLDPPMAHGLRAQALIVEIRHEGRWRALPVTEVRPGGRHDGDLLAATLGLSKRPTDRISHIDRFAALGAPPRAPGPVRPDSGEIAIDGRFEIVILDGSPALTDRAARDLASDLSRAFGVEPPPIRRGAPARTPAVVLGALDVAPPAFREAWREAGGAELEPFTQTAGAYAILVENGRVFALGRDGLGSRYAAFRLTERMSAERGAVLRLGTERRRPAFSPRAAAGYLLGEGGPDGFGFPDEYLSLMVRFHLDAIYLFQAAPYLDVTAVVGSSLDPRLAPDPGKIAEIRGLLARAAEQGLSVYWCATFPGLIPPGFVSMHPEIRGEEHGDDLVVCLSTELGRRFVEDAATRVAEAFPSLAGLVVLRTESSHTCGGRQSCERCRRLTAPDADPALEIFGLVESALHAVSPSMRVIAFDWRGGGVAPVRERSLPPGIDFWIRPDRILDGTPENDIRDVEPNAEIVHILRNRQHGRRIWIEGQLSHSFPFHTEMEVAAADLVWTKWERLHEIVRSLPRSGPAPPVAFGAGNGGGFAPTSMQDLVLRVALWEPLPDREDALRTVAARWYGEASAGAVRDAWAIISRATQGHVRFDKYVSRRTRVEPPGIDEPGFTLENLGALELLTIEWSHAASILRSAADRAPSGLSERARLSARTAESAYTSMVSLRQAMRFVAAVPRVPLDALGRLPAPQRNAARSVLTDELANVRRTIGLAADESALRIHPYYRNLFDLPALVAKERRIVQMLESL